MAENYDAFSYYRIDYIFETQTPVGDNMKAFFTVLFKIKECINRQRDEDCYGKHWCIESGLPK
jgi:hypothetical protein